MDDGMEVGRRKVEQAGLEAIYADYCQTCVELRKRPPDLSKGARICIAGIGVLALIFGMVAGFNRLTLPADTGGWLLLAFLLWRCFSVIQWDRVLSARAAKISKQKPGFADFYKLWSRNQSDSARAKAKPDLLNILLATGAADQAQRSGSER